MLSLNSSVYFLRSYNMNPFEPLVCLLLAVSYLGRAFVRQCDNRNYFLVQVCLFTSVRSLRSRADCSAFQAMAFLERYRKLHAAGQDCDEVDYNFGCFFQRLSACPAP